MMTGSSGTRARAATTSFTVEGERMRNPVDRPTFRALRKIVEQEIANQQQHGGYVALQPWHYSLHKINGRSLSNKDLEAVWPSIVKALGLIDDGTNSKTWTVPGKGLK